MQHNGEKDAWVDVTPFPLSLQTLHYVSVTFVPFFISTRIHPDHLVVTYPLIFLIQIISSALPVRRVTRLHR